MGEPVQYVSRSDDESISAEVSRLNDYVLSEDKPAKDKELADWSHIGGTSYRMVLPDGEADVEEDEAPFHRSRQPCHDGREVCEGRERQPDFQLLHP